MSVSRNPTWNERVTSEEQRVKGGDDELVGREAEGLPARPPATRPRPGRVWPCSLNASAAPWAGAWLMGTGFSLQQAGFAVVFLGAGMQRQRHALIAFSS